MALTLSSADLRRLGSAQAALLRPLDHASPEAWAEAVVAAMRGLLNPDKVVFLVAKAGDGPLYHADPLPIAVVHHTIDHYGLRDPYRLWFTALGCRTASSSRLWTVQPDGRRVFLQSEVFNEVYRPQGVLATAIAAVGASEGPFGRALLHLSAETWDHPLDSARTRQVLELLWPALDASVQMLERIGMAPACESLDSSRAAALVIDADGQVVHETKAMAAQKALDADGAHVSRVARALAAGLSRTVGHVAPAVAEVQTAAARYILRATRLDATGEALWGRPLVVVVVERCGRAVPRADVLRSRFRLTPQEARVALLLADRRTNAEIAVALGISPKTAGRHTENVFAKLGVRRRTAVAAALALQSVALEAQDGRGRAMGA